MRPRPRPTAGGDVGPAGGAVTASTRTMVCGPEVNACPHQEKGHHYAARSTSTVLGGLELNLLWVSKLPRVHMKHKQKKQRRGMPVEEVIYGAYPQVVIDCINHVCACILLLARKEK